MGRAPMNPELEPAVNVMKIYLWQRYRDAVIALDSMTLRLAPG
jgi:hypothetical protein